MLKTLRYIGIFTAVVISLLLLTILIIPQIDANRFKGVIETQISELTGRQFTIEGELYIEYTLPPLIRAEKIRFSNSDWGKQPDMLSIDLIQLKTKLIPLFDGELIIDQLLVEGAYISVEHNSQGEINWQLDKLASTEPPVTDAEQSERFQMPVLPVLKDIRFDNVNFYYLDEKDGIESDVIIDQFRIANAGIDEAINLSASGQVNQNPYSFSAKTEFLSQVTKQNLIDQGVAVKLHADALDVVIAIDGTIRHPAEARGIEIDAMIDADDLDNTFKILTGQSIYKYLRQSEQPLAVKASAKLKDSDDSYRLSGLSLKLAGNDVAGDLSYRDRDGRPQIMADLKSDRIDLNQILPDSRRAQPAKQSAKQEAATTTDSKTKPVSSIQLPKQKLPFDLLNMVDAEIKFRITEFHYDDYSPRSITLDARLNDRRLEVQTLDLEVDGTPIRSSLKIDSKTEPVQLHATLGIEKLQLQPLAHKLDIGQLKSGILTSIINLKSSGDNIDAIVRKLSGEANFRLSDTRIEHAIDGQTRLADIENLEVIFTGMKQTLKLELTGKVDSQSVALSAVIDPPLAILDNTILETSIKLEAVKTRLAIDGRVDKPLSMENAQLKIGMDIPQPRQTVLALSEIIPGVQLTNLTPKLPTRIQTGLHATSGGIYDLRNLRIDVGRNDLSGDIHIELGDDKPSIQADLVSESINLNELVPATRINPQEETVVDESPFGTEETQTTTERKKIFPDKPLPALKALDEFELDLDYQLKQLTSNQQTIDNIVLRLVLKDSLLTIDPVQIDFAEGTIRSRLEVNTVGTPRFTLDKKIIKVDYDRLMAIMGTKEYARGEMDAEIRLSGNGETIRELMASLDGMIRVTTVDGELNNESLKLLSQDIVSVIPFTDNSSRQKIHCGVVQMNIEDGIASTHSMVINTGAISALGTGDINLANETLSLYVAPRTKRTSVIKLALVPVNITGPLSTPSVRPDVAGSTISTTKTATNVGLAIATGGIWLLAEGLTNDLWDQFIDNTDYCEKALAGEKIVPRRIDLAAEKKKAEQKEIDELLDDEGYDW
jgi:uncharacterized protein involved in outer membrane biogenesis